VAIWRLQGSAGQSRQSEAASHLWVYGFVPVEVGFPAHTAHFPAVRLAWTKAGSSIPAAGIATPWGR